MDKKARKSRKAKITLAELPAAAVEAGLIESAPIAVENPSTAPEVESNDFPQNGDFVENSSTDQVLDQEIAELIAAEGTMELELPEAPTPAETVEPAGESGEEVHTPPAQEPAPDETSQETASEGDNVPAELTWQEECDLVTKPEIDAKLGAVAAALDVRARFQDEKDATNDNIHKTLKKARESLIRHHAALTFCVANVDPGFINRELHDGSRYNVYAIGKVSDLVDGLTGAGLRNKINIAVCRSLFRFRKAGLTFTGELARCAASDKVKAAAHLRAHLVSHTVSASTAPTQASSTMQALETLGIVKAHGSRKNPSYEILDTPATRRLAEVVERIEAMAA